MDVATFNTTKLRSRQVTAGPWRARDHRRARPRRRLSRAWRHCRGGGFIDRRAWPRRHGGGDAVAGQAVKQTLGNVKINIDHKVVWPVSIPISNTGAGAGRQGLLAPDGAFLEVPGMGKGKFRGRARLFGKLLGGPASEASGARRRPALANDQSGAFRTYRKQVGSAREGWVTHAGGRADVGC